MRAILLTLCLMGLAGTAQAQGQSAEAPSFFEQLDEGFTDWVVGPMFSVLFFDVVVWDDGKESIRQRCVAAGLSEARCEQVLEADGDIDRKSVV